MNYSEVEAKVREATNDDEWGPHGGLMQEVASYTYTYEHFPEVMGMLWKRMLHENKKNWRRVYKVRPQFFNFLFYGFFCPDWTVEGRNKNKVRSCVLLTFFSSKKLSRRTKKIYQIRLRRHFL